MWREQGEEMKGVIRPIDEYQITQETYTRETKKALKIEKITERNTEQCNG